MGVLSWGVRLPPNFQRPLAAKLCVKPSKSFRGARTCSLFWLMVYVTEDVPDTPYKPKGCHNWFVPFWDWMLYKVATPGISFLGDCLWNGSPYVIGPLSCLFVYNVGVLWPYSWMDQDETWRRGKPRPRHIVLDQDPAPPPKWAHTSQFSAHVCFRQTAGWIKMPLGTKVGLGPGHIVLHGDPASPKRGTAPPIFGPWLFWPSSRPSQLLLSTCRRYRGYNRYAYPRVIGHSPII